MPDPVYIDFHKKRFNRFALLECEVRFDDDFFHLSQIGERNFHNAYDADENFTMFRADAVFEHRDAKTKKTKEHIVPVFAAQMKSNGHWKWFVRFQPHKVGSWVFRVRVLCWHTQDAGNEPPDSTRFSDYQRYFEHRFGYDPQDYIKWHNATRRFYVHDTKKLSGPLESPSPPDDNPNYFYRWTINDRNYKRRAFFLLGLARPWVSENKKNPSPPSPEWQYYSHLDRKTDLFEPMRDLGSKKNTAPTQNAQRPGCNALLHWMAPWECQLVHQSPYEYWYQPKGVFKKVLTSSIKGKPYPYDARLDSADAELGYKRYDQGRALHMDKILDLAYEHNVLLFLVIMPHGLLRDSPHNWSGYHFGKAAEKARKQGKKKISARIDGKVKQRDIKHPSELNGFQLHKNGSNDTISIKEFFSMHPKSQTPWQRQLWKHYANFWRYLIGRWAAHPALGAWVLIDEMDGVGKKISWWWDNSDLTYEWHENVVKLVRRQQDSQWGALTLRYTGDYLKHPITSSATDYEGTDKQKRREILTVIRSLSKQEVKQLQENTVSQNRSKVLVKFRTLLKQNAGQRKQVDEKTTTKNEATTLINGVFGEINDHGDWRGGERRAQIDFVSHHAYHVVPTFGHWNRKYQGSRSFTGWHKTNTGIGGKKSGAININTDRWLWDSLCMRLYAWSEANGVQKCPHLITECGCWERDGPQHGHDQYGKRYPAYTHFANWAALVLGHAGIPFKWNDGKGFGEMVGRTKKPKSSQKQQTLPPLNPWDPAIYPNNYSEIANVVNFLKGVDLGKLTDSSIFHTFLHIEDGNNRKINDFNVWGLADKARTMIIAWIYDRAFSKRSWQIWLTVKVNHTNTTYRCKWFDTWQGSFISERIKASDVNGILKIRVPPFPTKAKDGIAVGNDIAVRITLR